MKALVVACLLCPEQCDAIVAKLVWKGYSVEPWVRRESGICSPIVSACENLVSVMMLIRVEHDTHSFDEGHTEIWSIIDEYKHFGKFAVDCSKGNPRAAIGRSTIKSDKALRQEHAEKYL